MAHLRLALLGPPLVALDGRPVTGFDYDKVRALLAYLAVEADRPHRRDALAGLLWPDQSEQAAHNSLRQALATLRRAIGDQAARVPFLQITREAIQFNPASDHHLDVAMFTALLTTCQRHTHRHPETCLSCARRLQEAVALYRGDFLAQFSLPDSITFEEWALVKREQLHQLMMQALIQLVDYHERRGESAQTQQYASLQLKLDPWREEAHQQLMRVLAIAGQRSAALEQYERCRRALADELGVEPESETTALYERIRDGQLKNTGIERFSILNVQSSISRHNFPAQTTTLIGREAELVELGALLENPAHRLITIVGPGGIGKTRLALQTAAEQAGAFAQGVCFVALAALESAELLPTAIADALGLIFQGAQLPKQQLLTYLCKQEMLLVLDNFEQLLDGAGLLAEIVERAPNVALLVTSRVRLALRAEWLFDLSGLPYPPPRSSEPLETYEAARLFLQSARQMRHQFAVTDQEAQAIGQICRLVEGLPLALELTAAAVREQSCAAIASAIETAIRLPDSPWRDTPERHRSMNAVFDHSWRLLSEQQRTVLRKLSVFRGGFEDEAAAQVAGATDELLSALLDSSLLRKSNPRRYDMHELVRQYAAQHLQQASEEQEINRRHLTYYLGLAEAAEPELSGPQQATRLTQLETEHNNLRAALAFCQEVPNAAQMGLRLAGALSRFWEIRGHRNEAQAWLQSLLGQPEAAQPTIARAKALNEAGYMAPFGETALFEESLALARALGAKALCAQVLYNLGYCTYYRGNAARGMELLEESLALYQELSDRWGTAEALRDLAEVLWDRGHLQQSAALLEESLAISQELGDERSMAETLCDMGRVAHDRGYLAQAVRFYEQSLPLARHLKDQRISARGLRGLGKVAHAQDDRIRVAGLYEQSLNLAQEVGDSESIANVLSDLAKVALQQGETIQAQALFKDALSLYRAAESHLDIAWTLVNLGRVAHQCGDNTDAIARFVESLALFNEWRYIRGITGCLDALAGIFGAQRQFERAVQLLAATEALRNAHSVQPRTTERAEWEHHLTSVRTQLGEAAFAAAWRNGRALTLEQAMEYALYLNEDM